MPRRRHTPPIPVGLLLRLPIIRMQVIQGLGHQQLHPRQRQHRQLGDHRGQELGLDVSGDASESSCDRGHDLR